uniref:Uncharacterized protein n=1 Tax=viral metagenome TaxID=1070528 RepID=A0A6C0HJT3_9ZZZZ
MPVSIDTHISNVKLQNEIELAAAVNNLKTNPQELSQFLQNQQSNVYSKILKQKDNTFQKVYGDMDRSTKVHKSVLMYNKRTKDLVNIQDEIYRTRKEKVDAVLQDKQTAGRKSEMNEWTVNNKRDTLFVMSSLFITLSVLLLLAGLWRMGMIGSSLAIGLALPLLLIFSLIVTNRAQYTDVLRNKNYWNKQIFEGKYGKIPLPNCPALTGITPAST